MKEQELKDLFNRIISELKNLGIPISDNILDIEINNRAKKRLGACRIEKYQGEKPAYRIEISAIALECNEAELCRILVHELLHTCPQCFNHGKKWKRYGEIVENALGYKISRTIKYEDLGIEHAADEEKVKYVIKCNNCGQIYERKRLCPLVKNPSRYRCGRCGLPLSYAIKSTTSCR